MDDGVVRIRGMEERQRIWIVVLGIWVCYRKVNRDWLQLLLVERVYAKASVSI